MYNKEDCFAFGPKGCNALKGWYSGDAGCLGCTFYKTREQPAREKRHEVNKKFDGLSKDFKLNPGKLRYLRQRAGLSRAVLAEITGVSPAAVGSWETGKSNPSAYSMGMITRALGCSITDLSADTGDRGHER